MGKKTATKIRPLGTKVLIRRSEGKDKVGLIHVPQNAKDVPTEGEILAVGKSVTLVRPGNVVLFHKYAGTEISLGNEDGLALMMNEEDVIAVIDER